MVPMGRAERDTREGGDVSINPQSSSFMSDVRYSIGDLVDLDQLRSLFDHFSEVTGFTIGLLDHPAMEVLIACGWREICTRYHREHPVAEARCVESNRRLIGQLTEPGKMVIEACDNGLVDCAMPIFVEGRHVATLATGQVLLEAPDRDHFRRQAQQFGVDEADYLAALDEIPVLDEARLREVTAFLGEMALVISQIGYARLVRESEVQERRRAEASLRESEEKYRALFEGAVEGILVADIQTKELQYANGSACEMFGYTREEIAGLPISAIHPPEALPRVVAAFEAQARGEKLLAPRLPCLRKDGSVFHADIVTRPVVIGGRAKNVGFFTDVSERMRAEEEQARLQAQLGIAQRMEAVGRLAGGIAHDFNNLLSVILSYTDFALGRTRPGDPLHHDLQQIARASDRAAELTRQLLAFSRKQDLELVPLDLSAVIRGMESMLRRTLGEDVELSFRTDGETRSISGDRGQLEQVIMNLAINARDAMPGGGRLVIEAADVAADEVPTTDPDHPPMVPHVHLTFTDSGCGMDEATRTQIFEPFFTTKEAGKGTGLGLSTVYGIVRQSGGAIRVDSAPGEGTTFHLYFPHVDQEVRESAPADSTRQRATGTETVLVAEDDDAVRALAVHILERAGFTVHAAANGGEALLICEQFAGTIQLLLTDVIMPRMHGKALADRLTRLYPDLAVLYMSGHPRDILEPGAADLGNVPFIAKPFTPEGLARKVREVLDAR